MTTGCTRFFVLHVALVCALAISSFLYSTSAFPTSAFGQAIRAVRLQAPANPVGESNQPMKAASAKPASEVTPGESQKANTEASTHELLVAELLKIKFDRTSASVLRAWSEPAKEKVKAPLEKENNEATPAIKGKVLNVFEDFVVIEIEGDTKPAADKDFVVTKGEEEIGTLKVLSIEKKRCSAKFANTPEPETLAKEDIVSLKIKIEPKPPAKETSEETVKKQVEQFQRDVTLGNWKAVKEFLAKLQKESEKSAKAKAEGATEGTTVASQAEPIATVPENSPAAAASQQAVMQDMDMMIQAQMLKMQGQPVATTTEAGGGEEKISGAAKVFQHLLTSLSTGSFIAPEGATPQQIAQIQNQARSSRQIAPPVYLTPDDILQLSEAAPEVLSDANVASLANLVSKSAVVGHDFNNFVKSIVKGTSHFGGKSIEKRLAAGSLFMKAGMLDRVEAFLPAVDSDETESNVKALKLWSELAISSYALEQKIEWLEKAWKVNQTILAGDVEKDFDREAKELAMQNLVELAPQVDKELGQEWLNASFTNTPDRGMLILSSLGTRASDLASKAAQQSPDERLKLLRIQSKAVESLIGVAPETAEKWKQACTLLAQNWLVEAGISKQYSQQSNRRTAMQIDMYGNYFWSNGNSRQQVYGSSNRQPQPIGIGDVLEIRPSEKWIALVDQSLHTQLFRMFAELHLRINEEDKAFPYIENIAANHPKISRELIHEFLRIWTQNHDPNVDKRQRNPYIYFYGFDQKADAIPLTRSKQQRNLKELSGWVARIRELPIEDIDESLLANAFTTCHSSAEVFDLDRVRTVFGDLKELKPETVAAICQKMRANLATNWRSVKEQETKQTKRREPEVQREVMRGYSVAQELANEALQGSPDNWQLHLTLACLLYDENDYSQTIQKSSEFSDRRDEAFSVFKTAAEKYAAVVSTLDKAKQSTEAFDTWFYAALGAVDLGRITDKTVADEKQFPMIRDLVQSLPGSMAEVHMAKFANNLFTRMSPLKPEMKFRYLNAGFKIVEDHPRAWEARNLFDYYKDLVHEIRLDLQIDGTDVVGQKPFGIYVNLVHTKEIERESGGFGKYVQNQNSMMYSYNYGRPTADYRDKFEDTVNQALGEHFEIVNVTFQSPKEMRSRPADEPGLRVTPYAYVLAKAHGPEVDRIAPLKIDLDFLDTSGYVVIPVESPAVVIDASDDADPRPVDDLKITQTLDERQAEGGKLVLDVTATARGLVPELDEIIDLDMEDFEVVNIDDQGNLPTSFDEETEDIQILSDRSWTVEYRAKSSEANVSTFAFSDAKTDVAENKLQRYEDADLVEAEPVVKLTQSFEANFSWNFLYWLIPLVSLALVGIALLIRSASSEQKVEEEKFRMPEEVNPFTVLTLLKNIRERNGINQSQATELQTSINRIETYYFDKERNGDQPDDLETVAKTWVGRTKS